MLIIIDFILDLIRLNLALIIILFSSTSVILSRIKEVGTKYEFILHILNIIGFTIAIMAVAARGPDVYSIIGLIIAVIMTPYSIAKLIIDFL